MHKLKQKYHIDKLSLKLNYAATPPKGKNSSNSFQEKIIYHERNNHLKYRSPIVVKMASILFPFKWVKDMFGFVI